MLISNDSDREVRFFCTFEPSPGFFRDGVDMDDLLESDPQSFRMLRVLWKRSFVKIDDQENQALKDVLLRRAHLHHGGVSQAPTFPSDWRDSHDELEVKVGNAHTLSAAALLAEAADGDRIRHEMALEAGLLQQLASQEENAVSHFGRWDYLTHQVPASPFKPVDYMDFIDVFGYQFIPDHRPTVAQFLVAELKRGPATAADVHQLLKYVDWVRGEYAAGDYGLVSAFLVAYDFGDDALAAVARDVERRYIVGRRPAHPRTWSNVSLLRYRFSDAGVLKFTHA